MENENSELQVIEKEQNLVLGNIKNIQITNDEENANASMVLKEIKTTAKKVAEYWKPLKESASKAHKNLCAKENEMLEPLKSAETEIKSKMASYIMEQEKKAREAQEALKKAQEEEALKQLEQSEKLKAEGNEVEAQMVEELAYATDEIKTVVTPTFKKQDGISFVTDYKISILDSSKVPTHINCMEIRPIDLGAIKKIVKMANGNIQIPGVSILEEKIVKARC